MSDLIFDFESLTPMPAACLEPAPATGTDPCSYSVPLRDEAAMTERPRTVRFDRHGDQFVLSPANSADILTWVGSHGNLPTLLSTVRAMNSMILGTRLARSHGGTVLLSVLAHYITTGEAVGPANSGEEGDLSNLASALLDVLTDSPETALTAMMGRLSVLRGQDWLNAEARERVRWIMQMTDLVPAYRTFREHFLSQSEYTDWDTLSPERTRQVGQLAVFAGRVILADTFDRPLRYGRDFRAAEAAYQAIYVNELEAGTREDFCTVLEAAVREFRGDRGLPRGFVEDCRLASDMVDRPTEEAVRETIRRDQLSETGLRRLQDEVEDESGSANMRIDWLVQQGDASTGGRIGEVLQALLSRVYYLAPDDERVRGADGSPGAAQIGLEVAPVIVNLNMRIDAQTTRRREYIISTLAVMRRLFPEEGSYPPARALIDGEFREIQWHLTEEERGLLRQFLRSLESRIGVSQDSTDLTLPLIEGSVCALGVAGLLTTHLVPQIGENPDLQLGLGTASAGLAGAGCTALLGHFLWPAITNDVHNRYLWEGLTGLGGAVISGGLYFLFSFLARGENGPMPGIEFRFPVDMYGP